MAEARSVDLNNLRDGGAAPLLARRLRAALRRGGTLAGKLLGLRPIEGVVDRLAAGRVIGWALDPKDPLRRLKVVARCEGLIVAEAVADLPRRDLARDGRGDGRCAFNFGLPADVLSGPARRIRIEAIAGSRRVRLVHGDVWVGGQEASRPAEPAHAATAGGPSSAAAGSARVLLALMGGGKADAVRSTLASWDAQAWPERSLARLEQGDAEAALEAARSAHTVVLARAGDVLHPEAARLLVQGRPLGEVLTWDSPGDGRRPEAQALGALLGESLGGAFALRGRVLDAYPGDWARDLAELGPRRLELWLASRPELRWAHIPAPLASRTVPTAGWSPIEASVARGLHGYVWRPAEGSRPARLTPAHTVGSLSLAVWPHTDAHWLATVADLAARAPDVDIEILAPASASADLDERIKAGLAPARGARLSVRRVDPPASDHPGGWLGVLGGAAGGEVVIFCHAGVKLESGAGDLDDLCAWAAHRDVGAVTITITGGRARLAGLALADTPDGWRLASADDPRRAGQSRPVFGAPAAFMAIARATLAAADGGAVDPLLAEGADLALAMRLRRMGRSSVLLGGIGATGAPDPVLETAGALAFGAFEAGELAAAARAFPARRA